MAHINCNTTNDGFHAPIGDKGDSGMPRYVGKTYREIFQKQDGRKLKKGKSFSFPI